MPLTNIFQERHGREGWWLPPGNSTTLPLAMGIAAPITLGTATARSVATTNVATRTRRLGYVSAATAAAMAGWRLGANQFSSGGGGDGLGGYYHRVRFTVSDPAVVAGARMFVGLSANSAAPTNIEPDTQANSVGIIQVSTSTTLQIFGSGSAAPAGGTGISLGANFPADGNTTILYELELWSLAEATNVTNWRVKRLGTTFSQQGTFLTAPSNTTLLGMQCWRSNNATLAAVGLDLCSSRIITDY